MKLPNKPSEILRLALTDFETMESSTNVYIDMTDWVKDCYGGCSICLAGAVMKNSLNISGIDELSYENKSKMEFINCIRLGNISMALNSLNLYSDGEKFEADIEVPSPISYYSEGEEQDFKNYIASMIGIFEAEGL